VAIVNVSVGDRVSAGDSLVQLETTELVRAVASATQNLEISEANLAELRAGPRPSEVAAARAAVNSAQAQLDDLLTGPTDSELAQAEAAVTASQTRLDDLLAGPSSKDVAQVRASLASARAGLEAAQARHDALDDQLLVAQNDLHNAQLAIDSARDMYNQLIWSKPEVAESWGPYSPQAAALRIARINYQVAAANLALAEIDVNDASLRAAEAQVAQAEAALDAVQQVQTAQIAAAEAQLARAEASLAALTRPNAAQIAAARAQLAQTIASLARLERGPSPEQITIAEAQLSQARISLEVAESNLDAAVLRAPFGGTVTAVHIAPGEVAAGPLVEIVDASSLEVVVDLDEIDLGAVSVGQDAWVTIETWPNRQLAATVTAIAPEAQSIAGIVVYKVHLDTDFEDLPVRTGMTANAELITAERQDVLLVPNRAVTAERSQSKYYVRLVQDDTVIRTEVQVGLRDSTYTEILDGLEPGDVVLVGAAEETIDFTGGPPEQFREMR
jgi:HlyD family secretion protein